MKIKPAPDPIERFTLPLQALSGQTVKGSSFIAAINAEESVPDLNATGGGNQVVEFNGGDVNDAISIANRNSPVENRSSSDCGIVVVVS